MDSQSIDAGVVFHDSRVAKLRLTFVPLGGSIYTAGVDEGYMDVVVAKQIWIGLGNELNVVEQRVGSRGGFTSPRGNFMWSSLYV